MTPRAKRCIGRLGVLVCLLTLTPSAGAEPIRILMLGDSITAGLGLTRSDALPARLEAAVRARGWDVRVTDAGVSGDTTAGGRSRLAWSLVANPHVVIVALGGNDGLRGIPPEETRRNVDAMLTELGKRKLSVLVAGMRAPRNLGAEYEEEFNVIFPELAAKHGVALYPFLLDGVVLDPKLNQPDLYHPNRAGVAVIVRGLAPAVIRLLEESQTPHQLPASS